MSLYRLKPAWQRFLRPMVIRMAAAGITANQVTLAACLGSVGLGGMIFAASSVSGLYLLLPFWLLVRMAFNAVDGMLAREHNQKSALGAYLNELCDVISDAALTLPFLALPIFNQGWVMFVMILAILSEFVGVMGPLVGATRRYDGPLGKSDRAFAFGALGLWIGIGAPQPVWLGWAMPLLAGLLLWTIVNRVRKGLDEVCQHTSANVGQN